MKRKTRTILLLISILLASTMLFFAVRLLLGQIETERRMKEYPVYYEALIQKQAESYGLDPYLVLSIVRCESSFDADALSPVGATGLMQVMPDTGAWIAHKLEEEPFDSQILYDPDTNIRYGCWYLSFLNRRLNGNLTAMIAGYNAGHGIVEDWLEDPAYTEQGNLKTIPYPETDRYVKKVYQAMDAYHSLYPDLFAGIEDAMKP